MINDAIEEAYRRRILVFAAASNCGGNDSISWPAKSDKVICVHATDGYGNSTRFTPKALGNADNFAVLGSAVKSYWPECLEGSQGEMRLNGTSCAAPIAAGIAALVMEFVRRKCAQHKDFATHTELLQRLGERQAMIRIFRKMVSDDKKNALYDYLEPWNLLDKQDKWYDEKDKVREILKIVDKSG